MMEQFGVVPTESKKAKGGSLGRPTQGAFNFEETMRRARQIAKERADGQRQELSDKDSGAPLMEVI